MKNKSRFLQIGGTLLMSVLFAACSQDEVTPQDTPLPEGKYPLEFTAYGLEAVATSAKVGTRATSDGDWNGMKTVYVIQNGNRNDIKTYNVNVSSDDNKTATLTSSNPFWWTNTDETKTVSAWYPQLRIDNKPYVPQTNCCWYLKTDQSAGIQQTTTTNYGDLLWAHATGIERERSTLTFKHLTTKVVINIMESDYLKGFSSKDISVTLMNFYHVGIIRENGVNLEFYTAQNPYDRGNITPHRLEQPLTEKAHTSFEALVIPENIDGQSIEIKVNNATYKWDLALPNSATKLEGGTVYTFNLNLKANDLTVTTGSSMTWNTGGNASGSVTIP